MESPCSAESTPGLSLTSWSWYRFHENSRDLNSKLIRQYIFEQNDELAELLRWNVAVFGLPTPTEELGTIDLGLSSEVAMIRRARLRRTDVEYADIKALMSKEDRVVDLPMSRSVHDRRRMASSRFFAIHRIFPVTGPALGTAQGCSGSIRYPAPRARARARLASHSTPSRT